jgi:hypothetical protein
MDPLAVVSYRTSMKPDLDYIKQLLGAIEGLPAPTCDVLTVRAAGIDIDDPKFLFHLRIPEDRGLLAGADREHPALHTYTDRGRQVVWTRAPMRLTASGHDFAAALRNDTVFQSIKTKAADASISVWTQVAGPLLVAAVSKSLGL